MLAGRVFSDGPELIQIDKYESWNYIRHPRMEERDYLRQSIFEFQPGLEIITDLDDVKILLFGEEVGRTPWEQSNLEPGLYRVRLIFRGLELSEFSVTVHNDRRTVVSVGIGEPRGTLVLRDMPSEAKVEIDGESYVGNEISVRAGKRRLRISAFGWETSESAIEMPPGGRVEWRYDGTQEAFEIGGLEIAPKSLPPSDRRGFKISWLASSSGRIELKILNPYNRLISEMPVRISAARGSVYWRPIGEDDSAPEDGAYRVIASDIGKDSSNRVLMTSLIIDSRFQRKARLMLNTLPGLLYAPGASMLPPGIWQIATGIGANIGNSITSSGFPVTVGFRISPGSRWELGAKFGVEARSPFDNTSVHSSLSGSWRINPRPGLFKINLALLLSHDGLLSRFDRIPRTSFAMILPGLHLITPMELSLGRWNLVLSPIISITFIGSDKENWRLASPVRTLQSLSLGAYYEGERFLVGVSTALRGPDFPRGLVDFALQSGLEGRFDLLGDASYLAVFAGVRYLDVSPIASIGIEVGLTG